MSCIGGQHASKVLHSKYNIIFFMLKRTHVDVQSTSIWDLFLQFDGKNMDMMTYILGKSTIVDSHVWALNRGDDTIRTLWSKEEE